MNQYAAWNLLLLQHFFSSGGIGSEVWLGTAPEDLDAIGPQLGGDDGFMRAVREGPPWPTLARGRLRGAEADFGDRALGLLEQRRRPAIRPVGYEDPGLTSAEFAGLHAPTYLPMLAALTRSAAISGPDGYYAQLMTDLRLRQFGSVQMRQLEPIWADLDGWTASNSGRLGRFVMRRLGGYSLIGVPRSQVILSRRDLERLPRLFLEHGFTPGGEVPDELLGEVRQEAAEGKLRYVSTSFQEALADPQFLEPITARLTGALQDWDGVEGLLSENSRNSDGASRSGSDQQSSASVRLALLLDNHSGAIHFHIVPMAPRLRETGSVALTHGTTTWQSRLSRDEWTVVDGDRNVGAQILETAALAEVSMALSYTESVEDEVSTTWSIAASLGRLPVRYFVHDGTIELPEGVAAVLVERAAPPAGCAVFILAHPIRVALVRQVLGSNSVDNSELTVSGLPAGWVLTKVHDASTLGAARDALPGDWVKAPRPKAMRFAGGQRVIRGGNRFFLDYDLPTLEIEAPEGAVPRSTGLTLVRMQGDQRGGADRGNVTPLGIVNSMERFGIEVSSGGSRHFLIQLIDREGEILESLTLRLAGDNLFRAGEGVGFQLGSSGEPASEADAGLSGALLTRSGSPYSGQIFHVESLGREASPFDLEAIADSAVGKFLDALSQKGSFSSTDARQLLHRLLEREARARGGRAPAEGTSLLSLWVSGFLEIETDRQGRWSRVHAVPPTMYTLPVLAGGDFTATITGTMRREHWRSVLSTAHFDVKLWVVPYESGTVPIVRLTCHDISILRQHALASEMEFVECPVAAVARWAGSLRVIEEQWQAATRESAGREFLATAESFKPTVGHFSGSRGGQDFRLKLYQGPSPDSKLSTIYMAGLRTTGGPERYAFIRDNRWGRWAALAAAADYFAVEYDRADLSPWPLEFTEDRRFGNSLWVPGMLGLPIVLARVLALASGRPPIVHRVSRESQYRTDDRITLIDSHTRGVLTDVSNIYDGYAAPGPPYRVWLEYPWVPKEIADIVASKLGGSLRVHN